MPGVPHHQHVEVVCLSEISNYIPRCLVFVDGPLCVPEDYNFIGLSVLVRDVLLVFIVSAPAGQVVDHVQDPTVVTDNVKVPLKKSKFLEYDGLTTTYVVDEGPVVLETEYDVIPAIIHEVVDH